ncbi:SDR family oxidoreductase [Aestuariispira insulae]|uniref:Uncharacterized protein YbjT (DUF2867 family) n=1 Tax=Aestuariispira insulae TaxID=1461337 RepID=A0A3D9H2I2_9PROT|nr:SDR family oxidoreductase [Aestuariispira insulae]RED43371.1 uncharacterized protein YbjT (DUF2867 family) [Aestuariispira insulae]
MDLIVGATGILGNVICQDLLGKGRKVRALVRTSSDSDKVAALKEAGAEIVIGDLKDPASLDAACDGVDAVITTASSTLSRTEGDDIETVDRLGQMALVEAAKKAGVNHFLFVSFPQAGREFPLQDAKRAVENAIEQSGMTYTILHPTHFREVWLSPALGFDTAEGSVRIFGEGQGRISWVSLLDVRDAVVNSLDNAKAHNRTIRLGGPEALTLLEVIERFEKQAGKSFDREILPLEALEGMHGGEDPLEKSFAALMMVCHDEGCEIDNSDAAEILGHRPSSIDEFAKQVLG